jgi:monofunctional chorismate mutase
MSAPQDDLKRLRASIDNIDAAVVHMLAERFKATKAVGELKAQHAMPPADKAREAQQIERRPRSRLRREIPQLHRDGSDPPSREPAGQGLTPTRPINPNHPTTLKGRICP